MFNIEYKYLCFNEKIPFEEHNGYKIAHLVQSYELKCPICGKMLKNSFKTIKTKAFPTNKIVEVKGIQSKLSRWKHYDWSY